eukprot:SAG31_NODE_39029_length_291_cov_1.057292_1_plen_52_part_10
MTGGVISAGEVEYELELNQCPAVFLGPNIGFVNVMEKHSTDGNCLLDVEELQ